MRKNRPKPAKHTKPPRHPAEAETKCPLLETADIQNLVKCELFNTLSQKKILVTSQSYRSLAHRDGSPPHYHEQTLRSSNRADERSDVDKMRDLPHILWVPKHQDSSTGIEL